MRCNSPLPSTNPSSRLIRYHSSRVTFALVTFTTMTSSGTPFRASLLLTLLGITRCTALTQLYCSTENTGSEYTPMQSDYQSNGRCFTNCQSQYAFAVVQYKSCWCSNYIPAEQSDVSNCSQNCPGYPQEQCGNENTGYYGYVALSIAPAGTAGASSSSSSPTTSSTPSQTSSSTTTPAPSLVTNTQVVTISGAVVTQTVTSTPKPAATSGSVQEIPTAKSSNNTAAIVGGVVGGLAGLLLIAALLFFLWRRHDNERMSNARKLDRNASVLSKAGLLAAGRNKDPEKSMEETNYGSQRHSAMYNEASGSPISAPGATYDRSGSLARSNSRPLVYDQRLNPAALMENWQMNGSRSSVNTMQDQRDYSRPLGITNPDVHDG